MKIVINCVGKCLTSLVFRQIQIKGTMRCLSSHTERTTKKKQLKIESAGKDVERLEPLYISDRGSDVGVLPPRETACASQNTKTFIRPQILPLGI